jgi:hypothetical protein
MGRGELYNLHTPLRGRGNYMIFIEGEEKNPIAFQINLYLPLSSLSS